MRLVDLGVRVQTELAGVLTVVIVVAAIGITELVGDAGRPATEVDAAVPGFTYQLRPGDTLRVGTPGASGWKSQTGVLAPVAQDATSSTFRATAPGVELVTTTVDCGSVNGFRCSILYGVVVTGRRPYDLALSGISGGTYVLRVGEEVVFGYDGVSVKTTSPAVLEPEGPFTSPGPGLSVFRAERPGQASLAFPGGGNCVDSHMCPSAGQMEIKFIVSSSTTRFDHYASSRDGGTTIHLRKGETFEVSLAPESGFEPWRWSPSEPMRIGNIPDQQLLDMGAGQGGLIDPHTTYFRNQNGWILPDRAGYLVKSIGTAQMGFLARPLDCRPAEQCPKLARLFLLTLEVDS